MDLNEIKKLIEDDGGKIIIVENGEPVMVITSFKDYIRKKSKVENKTEVTTPQEISEDELKIEDLPL